MKNTIAKKTEGYGYKYTELADINKYCLENEITYYQEVETCELNQKDYIITTLIDKNGVEKKHRGCQIVEARLSGINNPVQQYGSSLTYCRRYSLLMALGLATEDDDGASLTEEKEVTQEEADNYTLEFGKHKGKKINELPNDYIDWLLDNSKDERLLKIIELTTGKKLPSEEEQQEMNKLIIENSNMMFEQGTDREEMMKYFKVESDRDMTLEQLKELNKILKGRQK